MHVRQYPTRDTTGNFNNVNDGTGCYVSTTSSWTRQIRTPMTTTLGAQAFLLLHLQSSFPSVLVGRHQVPPSPLLRLANGKQDLTGMEELAGEQYKVIWILSSFYPVSAVAIAKTTRMNDADTCVMTELFNYRPPDICRDVLVVLQPHLHLHQILRDRL